MIKKRVGLALGERAINKPVAAANKNEGESMDAPKKSSSAPNKDVKSDIVIRDSFTMPDFDHVLIKDIQGDCLKNGFTMTKSEVLRAGVIALSGMTGAQLAKAAQKLVKVKTGRPKG